MNYLVIGLVLGWLTLTLGLLLYQRIRQWWHTRRYGALINYSVLLMEYGRKMTGAPDRQTLEQLLVAELPRVLRVGRAALLLPEAYQLVSVQMDDVCLPVSHAAVRWVASGGEAQRADHGRLQELVQQGRADLAWTQVWVPLMRGTNLRGMWLLGARDDDIQYAPEDLRWLTAIAREATAVLEATHYAEQERQSASEMRTLYRQVVSAQEVERGRLTRELHDGVLQDLCAVTRDLKALEARYESNQAPFTDLEDLVVRSGETVHALRAICNDLRPPLLQRDLVSALKPLVEALDTRSPAPVHIDIATQKDDLHLPQDVALAIFRITQEALHNAIQHADASEIAVRLTQYPDRLRLTVTDDGRGIANGVELARFVAQGHFGLAGMRERAAMIGGKLDVQTASDYGTVVILELPRHPIALETC
ncbi:MAG: sensor histidine kinase [Chloroflexi bacterium]|nr:sensor histidine kinase [Chloroflexota bacterium]